MLPLPQIQIFYFQNLKDLIESLDKSRTKLCVCVFCFSLICSGVFINDQTIFVLNRPRHSFKINVKLRLLLFMMCVQFVVGAVVFLCLYSLLTTIHLLLTFLFYAFFRSVLVLFYLFQKSRNAYPSFCYDLISDSISERGKTEQKQTNKDLKPTSQKDVKQKWHLERNKK